jgi:hypothetical protein
MAITGISRPRVHATPKTLISSQTATVNAYIHTYISKALKWVTSTPGLKLNMKYVLFQQGKLITREHAWFVLGRSRVLVLGQNPGSSLRCSVVFLIY